MNVKIKYQKNYGDLPPIAPQSVDAAGFDLLCADHFVHLHPGGRLLVRTGIILEIPQGYEGQIRPRSGLAFNYGVTVLNAPGTVDADYRGEIGVLLINHSENTVNFERGDRIAQIVFAAVEKVTLIPTEEVSTTPRGDGGFGSTGTH